MNNIKTTASGFLASLGMLAPFVGVPTEVGQATSVLGLFLMGLFAKDAKSGEQK